MSDPQIVHAIVARIPYITQQPLVVFESQKLSGPSARRSLLFTFQHPTYLGDFLVLGEWQLWPVVLHEMSHAFGSAAYLHNQFRLIIAYQRIMLRVGVGISWREPFFGLGHKVVGAHTWIRWNSVKGGYEHHLTKQQVSSCEIIALSPEHIVSLMQSRQDQRPDAEPNYQALLQERIEIDTQRLQLMLESRDLGRRRDQLSRRIAGIRQRIDQIAK
ncbi:hypothetical protein HGA91_03285 [candidate division WWE3 bacterium]|nr:hypothetical protein [candidate division WWE3 bacterium]